ncbi:attractin-like protein 1 [Nematolebias whitei]|uniref:attractin-like protein 1 n=1 Tax=Nematolebias whitei TaxID=451745 RepID=UPI001896DBC8|nr:attractin-like protein 1 [Nematolebias whitei]
MWRTYLGVLLVVHVASASVSKSCDRNCVSGKCVNGTCACDHGWVGDQCQHCQGRFRLTDLSGSLTDGPFNYKYKTKCTWLIEGYPDTALRLRFSHFATECSWDHMYVYDGDSIYAPLIAVFSGLVVPEAGGRETVPEVVTTSGYALLHFFSDAAYNLTGFNIAYSINSCPNNCSGHGRCSAAHSAAGPVFCECEDYWKGEACDVPYCREDCGSPDHGYCDLTGEKLCVCNDSWQGPDCTLPVPSTDAFWTLLSIKPSAQSLGRASHGALVHSGLMWVVGGYSFNYSNYHMVLNYNLDSSTWDVVPISSAPLHRYGHSLALHEDDIYMFGGKLETGTANVSDELWVFNIPTRSWSPRKPAPPPPPYALEGHTAHVVQLVSGEPVMLTFFGYSPIYSYINKVQEYNIKMLQPKQTQSETGSEQTTAISQVERISRLETMLQQVLTQQRSAQSNMQELGDLTDSPGPSVPREAPVATSHGQQLLVKPSELFAGDPDQCNALRWANSFMQSHVNPPATYPQLLKEFRRIFDRPLQASNAVKRLLGLRQGRRPVSEYALEFRILATQTRWDELALQGAEARTGLQLPEIFHFRVRGPFR